MKKSKAKARAQMSQVNVFHNEIFSFAAFCTKRVIFAYGSEAFWISVM